MKYKIGFDASNCIDPDEIMDLVLENRGVTKDFFHFSEDDLLPLESFYRIRDGYEIIENIMRNNEKTVILADTDVDGIVSAIIMYKWLKAMGVKADVVINHKKQHGLIKEEDYYDWVKATHKNLIIVDSLNKTIDEYKDMVENGVKILILDHHAINKDIPYDDYSVLISSQREYENPQLSGAGVVLKFCLYLDKMFDKHICDNLYDLCACGLVADMMDMTVPENRYLVSKGLEQINTLAIKKIVGSYKFNSEAISFSVAPIINAANRMDKNEEILKAFLTDDNKECLAHMRIVKRCREEQNKLVDKAMRLVKTSGQIKGDENLIFVKIPDIDSLSGLVATKIASEYKCPTIVVGTNYMGSMRSVDGINLMKMINDSGLAKAMGHEEAAGFECESENVQSLRKYLEDKLRNEKIEKEEYVDFKIDIGDISGYLVFMIEEFDRVTGTGFKPIKVAVNNINRFETDHYKDGKHLVLHTPYVDIVKWNSPYNEEDFEDASIFGYSVNSIGKLQMGFRNKTMLVADELKINEE